MASFCNLYRTGQAPFSACRCLFTGLKAEMAGVAAAQRRADEKAGTERALAAQLREKAVRCLLYVPAPHYNLICLSS